MRQQLKCVVLVLVVAAAASPVFSAGLKEQFRWKSVGFEWDSEESKARATADGQHVEGAAVPVGLEVWENRVFVTTPRWKAGVAASFSYFPKNSSMESPLLRPYPSWAAHNVSSEAWKTLPERIVSPFRMRADRCARLWVLDTGKDDVLGEGKQLAPPALLVFDLRSDTLLRRFEFPANQLSADSSFLANVAVDVHPSRCEDTFAYVADLGAYALLVYSWSSNASWRVLHNYFLSDPLQGEFKVRGLEFQWTDGLFGLALSNANRYAHRTLYFHAFAATHEFQVSTEILQNKSRADSSFHEFHMVGNRGPNSQSCASFMDEESGIIFYTQVNTDSITCWNSRTRPHYMPSTLGVVAQSAETLVFPNDVKVDAERRLWVLSDRLPIFLMGSLDSNDVNFRILSAPVDEAVAGTICDPAYSGPDPPIENNPLENRFGNRASQCSGSSAIAAGLAPLLALLLAAAVHLRQ